MPAFAHDMTGTQWMALLAVLILTVLVAGVIVDLERQRTQIGNLRAEVATLRGDDTDLEPQPLPLPTMPIPAAQTPTRRRHAAPKPDRRHRDTITGDAVFGDVYADADD